ncbi:hypothetical protein HZS_5781 [Henneguya salminicola]|nr:hypothetical protein HZS_5781 [Henneguya salminicola]
MFLVPLPDCSANTLMPIIYKKNPSKHNYTIGLLDVYWYSHLTVNHSVNDIDTNNEGIHIQNVENIWR